MVSLAITTLRFRSGQASGSAPLSITPKRLVLFVGPNNSGKTLGLREISHLILGREVTPKVLESISIDLPRNADEAFELLLPFKLRDVGPDEILVRLKTSGFGEGGGFQGQQISKTDLGDWLASANEQPIRSMLVGLYLLGLDGPNRFQMIGPYQTGDLKALPDNHLAALFKDDHARARLRSIVHDAFGEYLVIDPTTGGQLQLRMSDRPPDTVAEERGLDNSALKFHSEASPISEFGDGVRAFVGILAPLLGGQYRIILVDEPEAFLHPPVARRLGRELARIAVDRTSSTVVATHSADFVMGCLETAGEEITIVRLTFERRLNRATARSLGPTTLVPIFRNPLLRSSKVIDALFHQYVVATEGDSDRVFYEEVNRRLTSQDRGIQDCLFINAQNKQTVSRIIAPLREIGIRAAAVLDLDVINVGNTDWETLLNACEVPAGDRANIDAERKWLAARLSTVPARANGREWIKVGGINALTPIDIARAKALLDGLARRGIFIVPTGEVESWLGNLGISGAKRDWVPKILDRLGNDPIDPDYVAPADDDVWNFVDRIATWAENANLQP